MLYQKTQRMPQRVLLKSLSEYVLKQLFFSISVKAAEYLYSAAIRLDFKDRIIVNYFKAEN